MRYCCVCSTAISIDDTCFTCMFYKQRVMALATDYEDDIPAWTLEALRNSTNVYNTRTGVSRVDERCNNIRVHIDDACTSDFYHLYDTPSAKYSTGSALYEQLIMDILGSGLLPAQLTKEIDAYIARMRRRREELDEVMTYQSSDRWCACPLRTPNTDSCSEIYTGSTEQEALEKLYTSQPGLRPTKTACQ